MKNYFRKYVYNIIMNAHIDSAAEEHNYSKIEKHLKQALDCINKIKRLK